MGLGKNGVGGGPRGVLEDEPPLLKVGVVPKALGL